MKQNGSYKLEKTCDYGLFRKLHGNRDIPEKRVSKIAKSVDEIGQVPTPIIVNENMEVIDGQGRLELYKMRSLPVWYIVVPGLSREACIAMNRVTSTWTTGDFIDGFANDGNENYIRLQKLKDRYGFGAYKLSIQVVCCAVSGVFGAASKLCKGGHIIVTEQAEQFADNALAYVKGFVARLPKAEGYNKTYLLMALVFAYRSPNVDKEYLAGVFSRPTIKQDLEELNFSNVERAMRSVSEIYNKGRRLNDRIHLDHEYTNYKENNEPWIIK